MEKAYEEERGRRLATKDDIDNVVEQVRLVTKTTEDTRAEITGRVWDLQWHTTQKRDVYVRLIDALERIEIKRGILLTSKDEAAQEEARHAGVEAIEEFRRARVLAELLLTSQAVDATHKIIRHVTKIFKPIPRSAELHMRARRVINDARARIVEIGRSELRLSAPNDPE